MKILVTGAAGFLGSHLCDNLLSNNHKVLGVDNFFRGLKKNLPSHPNFSFIKLDIKQLQETKEIFNKFEPEIVIHYAAINGTKYFYDIPFKVCDDNIIITQNVLYSCGESVKKIIYASSSEVYGPSPVTPTKESEPIILHSDSDRDSYASSKVTGEFLTRLWAQENSKNYIIIRPFNTYGPRMATNGYGQVIPEFIERIKNKEDFYMYGDGKQTRSFCHVNDHVEIVSSLMEFVDNGIFNVGYDEEITIYDLAKEIHKIQQVDFSPKFKQEWKNDTKWRKPCLLKIKKSIPEKKFIKLREGIKDLLNYY